MVMFSFDGLAVPTRITTDAVKVKDPAIYYDVVDAPDPITFRVKIRISNNSGQTLYFQAVPVSLPSGWSMDAQNLGSVANGAVGTFTITLSRTKPTIPFPELIETVRIAIRAYLDANYTQLYGAVEFDITFIGIDSSDPNWTVVDLSNFDNGAAQGWSVAVDVIRAWSLGGKGVRIMSDRYASPPYSLTAYQRVADFGHFYGYVGITKSFDMTPYTRAYIVLYSMKSVQFTGRGSDISVGELRLTIGDAIYYMDFPSTWTWFKVVAPVPVGDVVSVKIQFYASCGYASLGGDLIVGRHDSIKVLAI